MIRNVHTQIAQDKGVDIREPSTANFLIDSEDRTGGPYSGAFAPNPLSTTCADFSITKNQSLMNGFFTRLAVQEVNLQCGFFNVSPRWGNTNITIQVQGAPATYVARVAEGFYTVEQYLNGIVLALNALPAVVAANTVFSIVAVAANGGSGRALRCEVNLVNTAYATANNSVFATQLGIAPNQEFGINNPNAPAGGFSVDKLINRPDIRGLRYIDFVSPQLTYNQSVKDASTFARERDVLYRWYLGWDDSGRVDGMGFPIYEGYEPFNQRRCIAFPKQINWSPNQPIGAVQFTLYDQNGNNLAEPAGGQTNPLLIPATQTPASAAFRYCATSSWTMTLLVSEV